MNNLAKINMIENLLYIDNKEGVIVPFKFNKLQRYFHTHKGSRNVILKFRQGGCSSSVLADQLTDCMLKPNTQCAVVSHETRSTQRLLDRVQFFYDSMEEPKPIIGAESRSEKTFPEMHSTIYIGTAGARAFGHGDTIKKALLSELALYAPDDAERILNGVEDAVPITGELTIECYDDQTEVLTDRGWLLFKDVELWHKVLSKDIYTNEGYWSKILRKIKKPAKELISITGETIDLAVTPNHNIRARKDKTIQPFKAYQAKELANYSEWQFDCGMEWQGTEQEYFILGDVSIPMDLWLEYLGFFLSEGWVEAYAVSFYQKGEYRQRFMEVAKQVASCFGKKLGVYAGGYQFCIPGKSLANYLTSYTKPKRVPRAVIDLSRRQLSILFKAYMMGDGMKERLHCVTKDIPLRDSLQEIGLKLGYGNHYTIRKARVDNKGVNHQECYEISFFKHTKPSVRLSRGQVNRIPYNGDVYCLSIPENHLLMIRRRGKMIWCGNCTAQGEDNKFYEVWSKAREGKSPYKAFFFPWWWEEGYQIPLNSDLALPEDKGELSYTSEETDLVSVHHLTEAQIRWRRWKLSEKGALFFSQYPENEVDCWLVMGDPVFEQSILSQLALDCYEGKKHESGWTYWLSPEEKLRYIIGVDTASGAPGGSYSAACVLNDRYEVCATLQLRAEPHIFAELLRKLGVWYNTAELVIERNFTGYAVLEQLMSYPKIANQRDFTTGRMTTQRGWWSNEQTRTMMMTIARDTLGKVKIWDSNLVRQLRSYRYVRLKTKYREQAQMNDDLAFGFMLALAQKKVVGTARGFRGSYNNWSW